MEPVEECMVGRLVLKAVTKKKKKIKRCFQKCLKYLCSIVITIPVSSAACKRTFSCLKRLKNFSKKSEGIL